MTEPRVSLELSDFARGAAIRNLWPLYVHDLSPHSGQRPNSHGVLIDDPDVIDTAMQGETLRPWWSAPDALFPYSIVVDGVVAGFDFVVAPPRLPEHFPAARCDADFIVHEFFVLRAFRGSGVAEHAAHAGFARHPGRWEVVTDRTNARAIAFWRRAIERWTEGEFTEEEGDHVWGRKVIFRFRSS